MDRITVMIRVADTARADIALTPTRTYYRFATDSSIEDGELAAIPDFEGVAIQIAALTQQDAGERSLPEDLLVQVFLNNRLATFPATESALRQLLDIMVPLAPEFQFLNGFRA